jgi:hypothetical protein
MLDSRSTQSHALAQTNPLLLLGPKMSSDALTWSEFELLSSWKKENEHAWTDDVRAALERLMALYLKLTKDRKAASDTLRSLWMAMGIIPKSERGAQLLEKN